ncbi:hypothetical protein PV726_47650 [Streptomyces europaeiscabiei]|uniref:hypothetical protein n=1 Tax=Streptomyces europaeiscabiei TaxID=146819 RepID=UPI0029BA2977|nr:hypothetical protein [Streptomyces europaeiscabiei]MDX3697722.1 hypothetical protein [Streptomyces europaeiscabiei]
MLSEAMIALAAAGGTAVVQAASTDAWMGFRQRVARWFGRGNPQRESAELERLDQTATALETADAEQAERVRIRQEASWETWFTALLESLDDSQRETAAEELRALLAEHAQAAGGTSAETGGLAAGRDINIEATDNSIAAGTIAGGASIGHPHTPDPSQG